MSERWLVTGARGFLGRHACDALRGVGCEVVPLDRTPPAQPDGLVADLTEGPPDLASKAPDVVVHLASLVFHAAPGDAFERAIVGGTRNLLAGLDARPTPPRSFIYASTVAIYGALEGELLAESTEAAATSPYGASKWKAERLVSQWAEERGVRAAMLRLPGIVGRGMVGTMTTLIDALARRRYVGIGPGTARRSLVLADEVAAALPALSEVDGPLHLTDRAHPSFVELEAAICRRLGRRRPWRIPGLAARAVGLVGDAVQALGMSPRFTTDTYKRTTSTLTFDDTRAVRRIGWSPTPVVEAIDTWME